jgi:DNA-binding IclR family transcriptional regulator
VNQAFSKLNSAAVLDRGIGVLLAVKNTPVATASEIQQQVMPDVTKRAVQCYLKNLVQMGLLYAKHSEGLENRYYLSGKAKQLFEVKG